MRSCSWSAAMRLGTTCTERTTRAFTGARTTCSASAARISFSDSGAISQNVKVKSNGVWLTAQKFAYVRSESVLSSGTIVKLICLGSFICGGGRLRPSILSHHADDNSLDLHLIGVYQHWLHRRIRRLKTDAAIF